MQQVNWFERNFNFGQDQNIFPSIIERLQGTALRLEHKLSNIEDDRLSATFNNKWSVKQHAGHLADLEPLWQKRLEDIVYGNKILTEADLTNSNTTMADHNSKDIKSLLQSFRERREQTLNMLAKVDENILFRSAMHPRLNKPMRTIDLFSFVADHDDHHLAAMTHLLQLQSTPV